MFSTATQSGKTDTDGAFLYIDGEDVCFFVGDVLIGQATGAPQISPFDLAGITPPQTALEVRRATNDLNRTSNMVSPLDQVINIAVFLQTLDDDGDLDNGIQIPDQIHTLATGASINFDQKLWPFSDDFQFRKLMALGRAEGLWGGERAIRHPAIALDSLYDSLGIIPEIYALTILEIDEDGDNIVDIRKFYDYDDNGNLSTEEWDNDADDSVDKRIGYTYDTNGNQVIEEIDGDADYSVDERITYTYDTNGNQVMEEIDGDADYSVDERITYTYDTYGNMTKEEDYYVYDDEDFAYYYYYNYYNSNGDLVLSVEDWGADGTVNDKTGYGFTYDENGNLLVYEIDYNADDFVDERILNTYDTNGNMILREYADIANEIIDYRIEYAFDEHGRWTLCKVIYGADDTVNQLYTATYDANGNMLSFVADYNGDGTADARRTMTYNTDGIPITTVDDTNDDGTVDARFTYTYEIVNSWINSINSVLSY